MTDASILVAKFAKNATEEVRISLDEFKGKKLVNIRVWYTNSETGQKAPGKQGIALSVDKFEALMAGLKQMENKLASIPKG
jgi:hypothetical protein